MIGSVLRFGLVSSLTLVFTPGCFLSFDELAGLNETDGANGVGPGNQIAGDPCAGLDGVGQTQGHFCDYGDFSYEFDFPIYSSNELTCQEALEECDLIGWVNDSLNVYCEWNGIPIFLQEQSAGACDDAQFGGTPGDGVCGEVELNVIGTYEARSDHSFQNHPTGETTVHIERQGPQVLVLSASEPIDWTVTAVPGADIQEILVLGYHTQTVNAPPGVPVQIIDYENDNEFFGCAYEFPDSSPFSGCETAELFPAIESLTNLEISSFHGCYRLTDVTLHSDLSVSGDCPTPSGYNFSSYFDPDCGNTPSDVCGDFVLGNNEECDDGNSQDGDGCSANCTLEAGCDPYCGDGVLHVGEECDDGNNEDGDGCSAECVVEHDCE